ncbi:MAG: Mn2 and fe2 transporter of the nramp family protein [Acidimicrobiaceae bacterium]|nr:Mn2 and fe2 transporter of the nramp family protein [Acidimicrobiaceae bacterium]
MQREHSKETTAITGAFGTITSHDDGGRRGLRARLLTLIAIIGPGLIVMVGDNDAGGVSTYAQAGQNFGYTLLWTLPLLVPVLIIIQEMVARLGAVTGVGHGRLIRERFGRYWGNLSIFSILFLNFLIIVTEFIGISLAMEYFGVSPYFSVPVAVVLLFSVTASGSFRRWERFMMLFIAINFIIVPLVILTHPSFSAVAVHSFVPKIRGGASSGAVLLIISIIGTTVAPWQLFFQESNIVDKRITPRWLNYERVDTIIGSFVVVIVAGALVAACAVGLAGHADTTSYTNALGVARGLGRYVGHDTGALFALLLLNASIIGAAVVTLASSYALGDLSSTHQGLNARLWEAKGFYGGFAALLVLAGTVAVVPGAPLGVITLAVQALCGLMLPSTTIIVLMLANDRELMGPWKNGRLLNVAAVFMVVVLVVLSLTLMISTLFTSLPVLGLLETLAAVGALGLVIGLPVAWRRWRPPAYYDIDKRDWRTPRLALLAPMPKSKARTILMRSQSVYLFAAGILLIVRFVQLLTS